MKHLREAGSLQPEIRRQVLERDSYTCQQCGLRGVSGYKKGCVQVHHIVAYRQGGTHSPDNLITLCVACHKRADRVEWIESMQEWQSRHRIRLTPQDEPGTPH